MVRTLPKSGSCSSAQDLHNFQGSSLKVKTSSFLSVALWLGVCTLPLIQVSSKYHCSLQHLDRFTKALPVISHILHPHLKSGHDAGAARRNKRAGSGAEQNHGSVLAVKAMLEKRGCNEAPQTPALLHLTQGGRCGRAVPQMSDSPHQASSPPSPTLSPRHQIQVIFPQIFLPRLPMTAQPRSAELTQDDGHSLASGPAPKMASPCPSSLHHAGPSQALRISLWTPLDRSPKKRSPKAFHGNPDIAAKTLPN